MVVVVFPSAASRVPFKSFEYEPNGFNPCKLLTVSLGPQFIGRRRYWDPKSRKNLSFRRCLSSKRRIWRARTSVRDNNSHIFLHYQHTCVGHDKWYESFHNRVLIACNNNKKELKLFMSLLATASPNCSLSQVWHVMRAELNLTRVTRTPSARWWTTAQSARGADLSLAPTPSDRCSII